jgi:hypothetical protein
MPDPFGVSRLQHPLAEHIAQGEVPEWGPSAGVGGDGYFERMTGEPNPMAPYEEPVPIPRPRPDWGIPGTDSYHENMTGIPLEEAMPPYDPNASGEPIPGTDDYYQQQTGEPIDLSPASSAPSRMPGRFGGNVVPSFAEKTGFQRTAAEGAPAAKPATEEEWKRTESMRRDTMLARQAFSQVPAIMNHFEKLGELRNIAGTSNPLPSWMGGNIPGAQLIMSSEGKIVRNSLTNIIGNWLYLTSGATVNLEELRRRTDEMMPTLGDDDQVIADKKARIYSILEQMASTTNLTDEYNGLTQNQQSDEDRLNDLLKKYGDQ